MKPSLKPKTIFVAIIIGVISLFFISWLFIILQNKPNPPTESAQSEQKAEEQQQPSTITKLSYKEQIEKEIIETKGENYTRFALEEGGERNFIVTYYQSDLMTKSLPREKRKGAGILVFKIEENGEIKKFWESKEEIYLTLPVIQVRDITGDGKTEILALWSDGNKVDALYIYSWTGDTFQLITPKEKSISPYAPPGTWNYAFGSYAEGIKVKDLDGDKIEEVIIMVGERGYDEETREMKTKNELRRTYKWAGVAKQYYLWKEEKIGEEKPEVIE